MRVEKHDHQRLQQISDHVWILPAATDKALVEPAIGAIITRSHTVLVDAGNCPAHAQRMLGALRAIDAPPIQNIIYTHHHWDHTFGALAYNVPVIAHEQCLQAIIDYAKYPWGPQWLKHAIAEWPGLENGFTRLMHVMEGEWPRFKVIYPTVVYDEPRSNIAVDDITLTLEHIGGGHAYDSTIVTIQEDGVMFMGDCFYPAVAYQKDQTGQFNFEMLRGLLDRDLNMYIDGHTGAFAPTTWHAWMRLAS